jgi:hypothetical protein
MIHPPSFAKKAKSFLTLFAIIISVVDSNYSNADSKLEYDSQNSFNFVSFAQKNVRSIFFFFRTLNRFIFVL